MKKLQTLLMMAAALLALISCSKNDGPSFEPSGNWNGYIAFYNTTLVNHPDGKAAIFIAFDGTDTASALEKHNGYFTYANGKLTVIFPRESDSLILKTTTVSENFIEGVGITTNTQGSAIPFKLYK